MFRCSLILMGGFYKARSAHDLVSNSANILQNLARGFPTVTSLNGPAILYPLPFNLQQLNEQLQEIKCPKQSTVHSGLEIPFPSLKNFAINKKLPSINFDKNIRNEYFQDIPDIIGRNDTYWMGSVLKKRRRKMNRQKYKKRRKRDRFKREALKNLRERKHQRKERAAERKQEILSNMVVNKSISKRRARYLSHKLLPGVLKGQGLG